jgi:anti-sigma regulatory factor (Ser/Thr protein kinase)
MSLMMLETPELSLQVRAERIRLTVPSLPHWIEPTVEYLRQRAVLAGVCTAPRSGKLMLALHEALSNSIIHGNLEVSSELKELSGFAEALARATADPDLAERTVDIDVEYNGRLCTWILTDEGKGFDVDETVRRCLCSDPEILLSSGRGILMMRSFLDDVQYELGGRRVILTLRRETSAPDQLLNLATAHGRNRRNGTANTPLVDDPRLTLVRHAIAALIEEEDHPNLPENERRIYPRMSYNERLEILAAKNETPVAGFCRDISRGGIAFISVQPLSAEVTLLLPTKTNGPPLRIRVQVVRCAKIMPGLFDVGARFLYLET